MRVTRYTPSDQAQWDAFLGASKNGTFLLRRGYMDYHSDRFVDHSVLFHNDKDSSLPSCRQTSVMGFFKVTGG